MDFIIFISEVGFDTYLTAVLAKNAVTIVLLFGVAKLIAKLTPGKIDDKVVNGLSKVVTRAKPEQPVASV